MIKSLLFSKSSNSELKKHSIYSIKFILCLVLFFVSTNVFAKPAKDFLVKEGYDHAYGARPIKRAIQKYVEDIVADAIIDQTIKKDTEYTIK
jgi:hypothetical protein